VWLDGPSKGRCLVLWRRLPDVAASIASWAASYGMSDSVMLLDELASGPEVAGTGAARRTGNLLSVGDAGAGLRDISIQVT
jgi:hypothetical protein